MEECPYAKRRKLTAFFDDDDDLEEEDDDEDDQMAGQEKDGTREVSERHEELNDQLRQFQVLDEVQGDNSEDENDGE